MEFLLKKDYDILSAGDKLRIASARDITLDGKSNFLVEDITQKFSFETTCSLTERDRKILLEGGLLNFLKGKIKKAPA